MKINILISVFFYAFFLFGHNNAFCQFYSDLSLDTINRVDEEGKKTGYWIEFHNSDLSHVKKKKNATYFSYALYKNDLLISNMPDVKPSSRIFYYFKSTGNTPQENKIVLLDGIYSIYYKRIDVLAIEFEFNNGHLLRRKEYSVDKQLLLDITYNKDSITWISYKSNGDIGFIRNWKLVNDKWKEIFKNQ